MSSRIEQLIDELEEYIESCKPKFMSNSEIIVNKDEIDELIRELRMKTPDEIRRYQKIINNKDAILNDARTKAQALIDEATVHTTAARQAQEILDKATMEANELRMQASRYTEDRLAELESIVLGVLQSSSTTYESLIGSLGQYRDVIQSNIRALHPVEEDLDSLNLDDDQDDSVQTDEI